MAAASEVASATAGVLCAGCGTPERGRVQEVWMGSLGGPLFDKEEFRRRCSAILAKAKDQGGRLRRPKRAGGVDLLPIVAEAREKVWDFLEATVDGKKGPGKIERGREVSLGAMVTVPMSQVWPRQENQLEEKNRRVVCEDEAAQEGVDCILVKKGIQITEERNGVQLGIQDGWESLSERRAVAMSLGDGKGTNLSIGESVAVQVTDRQECDGWVVGRGWQREFWFDTGQHLAVKVRFPEPVGEDDALPTWKRLGKCSEHDHGTFKRHKGDRSYDHASTGLSDLFRSKKHTVDGNRTEFFSSHVQPDPMTEAASFVEGRRV